MTDPAAQIAKYVLAVTASAPLIIDRVYREAKSLQQGTKGKREQLEGHGEGMYDSFRYRAREAPSWK